MKIIWEIKNFTNINKRKELHVSKDSNALFFHDLITFKIIYQKKKRKYLEANGLRK